MKRCHRTPQIRRPIGLVDSGSRLPRPSPIEAGATYVFDLGYYDYAWWAKMDAKGCRLVTRFKANTPLACIAEWAVPEGGTILSDRIGHLPARRANSRKNPFVDAVREVRIRIETGKVLRILSKTSTPPPRRSPTSTSGAGRSSCSSGGSSKR